MRLPRPLVPPDTSTVTVMPPTMAMPMMVVPIAIIRAVVIAVIAVVITRVVAVVVVAMMIVVGRSRCRHGRAKRRRPPWESEPGWRPSLSHDFKGQSRHGSCGRNMVPTT